MGSLSFEPRAGAGKDKACLAITVRQLYLVSEPEWRTKVTD